MSTSSKAERRRLSTRSSLRGIETAERPKTPQENTNKTENNYPRVVLDIIKEQPANETTDFIKEVEVNEPVVININSTIKQNVLTEDVMVLLPDEEGPTIELAVSVEDNGCTAPEVVLQEVCSMEVIVEEDVEVVHIEEMNLVIEEEDETQIDTKSLQDSSEVECVFDDSSPILSPRYSRSSTRRTQKKKMLKDAEDSSKGELSVLVEENEQNDTDTNTNSLEDSKILRYIGSIDQPSFKDIVDVPKTSSTEIEIEIVVDECKEDTNEVVNDEVSSLTGDTAAKVVNLATVSPYNRTGRLLENASLMANYSGTSSRDITATSSDAKYEESMEDSTADSRDNSGSRYNLRCISGRRSTKPLREFSLKNLHRMTPRYRRTPDDTNTSMNVTIGSEVDQSLYQGSPMVERSLKRMRQSVTPEGEDASVKKVRVGNASSSVFSYSPMAVLRNKFSQSQIKSSTPKSFRNFRTDQELPESANVSGINPMDVNDKIVNGEVGQNQRWCSIM